MKPFIRVVLFASLTILATSSFAATFTVSDGGDSGPGTLRQAILDANGNPGADAIVFTTPFVSAVGSLPEITGPVTIDGTIGISTAQVGGLVFDGNTAFDFRAGSGGSILRNIRINDYPNAVRILSVSNITVTRVSAPFISLNLNGDNNLIGGTAAGSGNQFLFITGSGDGNQIFRNQISNVDLLGAQNNRFGDATNGNTLGIVRLGNCPGTILEGNTITGGVRILDSGTPSTGTRIVGNTIRNTGVSIVTATPGIEILGNSIDNVAIPIDLGNDGPTANDAAPDADTGANNLQNYPVLTSAAYAGGFLQLQGTLTSTPLYLYRIEVFSDDAADPEARTFITAFNVSTDATGVATFNVSIPTTQVAPGDAITTTATHNVLHDTSEVSAAVIATAPGAFTFDDASITVNEADGTATLTVLRTGGSDGTVTVDYTTQDSSATAPSDYATTSGTLTFGPGVTSQPIIVPIVSDGVIEVTEMFVVELSNPTGGSAITTPTATVTITGELLPADATVPTLSQWSLILLAIGLAIAMLLRASTV